MRAQGWQEDARQTIVRYVKFILILLTLGAATCTIPAPGDFGKPATTTPGEVRFELAAPNDAAILVPVRLNGHGPYTFVLDTGATFTCLDQKLIDQLKLPEWRGQFGAGVLAPTKGNVRLVSIDTLEVGNVKATDLKACAIEFFTIADRRPERARFGWIELSQIISRLDRFQKANFAP